MKAWSKKWEYIILGILLLFGFLARLYNFASFSLSNDELSAVYRLNFENLGALITNGVGVDYHPAGVQVFLYYWTHWFGFSEASIRFPFIIAGTLAILFTYLFSRRWFGATPALLSASAIAFLEFPILYSQIARPYGSGLLFSLILVWLWSIVLFPIGKEKKKIWVYSILLGFAFAANLYNHYFSGLLAFIIGISALFYLHKDNVKPYLLATFWGSILFLPHIEMTLFHMSKGGLSSWLAPPNWNWPIHHLDYIFNGPSLVFLEAIIVSIVIVAYLLNRKYKVAGKGNIRLLIISWFIIPLLIGLIYSIFVNPVLQHSILIFSMPFLIIWLFSFIPGPLNKVNAFIIGLISVIIFGHTVFLKKYYFTNHFQDFKGIAELLIQAEQNSKTPTLRIMDSNSPEYIKYYLKNDTTIIRFSQWKINDEEDLEQLRYILEKSQLERLEYVLLGSNHDLAFNMMINQYPYLNKHVSFSPNAQYFALSKLFQEGAQDMTKISENPIAIYRTPKDSIIQLKDKIYSPGMNFHVKPDLLKQNSNKGLLVQIALNVNSYSQQSQAHIVVSMESIDCDEKVWKSAPLRYFTQQDSLARIYIEQSIPITKHESIIKAYIWNPEQEELNIQNLEIHLGYNQKNFWSF